MVVTFEKFRSTGRISYRMQYGKNADTLDDFRLGYGRCVDICQNVQNVWALSYLNRGLVTKITKKCEVSEAWEWI